MVVRIHNPGDEAYAQGAAAAEAFAALLPPGAHFVLLVACDATDGGLVACVSNVPNPVAMARAWAEAMEAEDD